MGDYASSIGYMAVSHHTGLDKHANLEDFAIRMGFSCQHTLVFLTLHRSQAFKTCLRLTRKTRCPRFSPEAP